MEGESEWRSSSEEGDDAGGMGRFYECVFCKRGFTTAQALGGHMNIHRKDRGTNKPSRPKADHHDDHNNNYHYYNSLQYPSHNYPLHHYPTRPAAHEVNINNHHSYHAFSPVPMMSAVPPAYLDLFGEDEWRKRNLLAAAGHPNREIESGVAGGDGGLDLELRLGHDRRH